MDGLHRFHTDEEYLEFVERDIKFIQSIHGTDSTRWLQGTSEEMLHFQTIKAELQKRILQATGDFSNVRFLSDKRKRL